MTQISESEMILPTLKLLSKEQDGYLSTTDLIKALRNLLKPSGDDLTILDNRSDDKFSQKVRNIIAHKNQPNNIIHNGYAEHKNFGIMITSKGREYIK